MLELARSKHVAMHSSSPSPSDSENYQLNPLHQNRDSPRTTRADMLILPSEKSRRLGLVSRHLKLVSLIRVGTFILIELGFISLASVAVSKPRALPLHLMPSISLTEAKGALTLICIIWHGLAIFAVKEILLHIFSAEWMEQVRRSGKLVLRETDVVSRMTTGYVDQVIHFSSRKATMPFRLGFICALLLIALNAIGPSTVTVNTFSGQRPMMVNIANLTMTQNLVNSNVGLLVPDRANLVTRLEQLENSIYGFRAEQPNILIPWPSSDLISSNSTIQYKSDVITYNFTCSWRAPSNISDISLLIQIDGQNWTIFTDGLGSNPLTELLDAVILPLEMDGTIGGPANSPLSGFFLVGSNTTLSGHVALNLEGVPTVPVSSGQLIQSTTAENATEVLLATSLLCDPQLRISPATVTLQTGSLWADIHQGSPVVKNIPQEAANALFSQSLLFAASTREAYGDQSLVNNIARILFLADPSFEYDENPAGIKPLPIGEINQRMNRVLLSSAKAYLSGYRPNDNNLTFPSFEMIESDAIGQEQQFALVGSRPFLIALAVVVGGLVALLITLVTIVKVDELQTFDLENIVQALRIH
ncbi:hypothetical protein D9756_005769 [Leucocoprinus leucothites]|uniref:Uncharacterized protein n=1 Tax=Leucocoprinus leucothites TaxID=201217 RepID=A0A8H5D778_9AGAR|nr:hypothetical protein D9756_005769 [Leucoagaricus leucothites]